MDFNEQSYYKAKQLDISKDEFKTILEVPSQGEVVRFIEKYEDPDKFIKISQSGSLLNVEILSVIKGDNQANFIQIVQEQITLDNFLSVTIYKLNKHSFLVKELRKLYCLRICKSRIKVEKVFRNIEIGHLFRIDDNQFVIQYSLGLKIFHSRTFKIIKCILSQDILLLGTLSDRDQVLIQKDNNLYEQNICTLQMKQVYTCDAFARTLFLKKKYLLSIEYSIDDAWISICDIHQASLIQSQLSDSQETQNIDAQEGEQSTSKVNATSKYSINKSNKEQKEQSKQEQKQLKKITKIHSCSIYSHEERDSVSEKVISCQDFLIIIAQGVQNNQKQTECLFFKIESNQLIDCPKYYFNEEYPSLAKCLSFHNGEVYFFIQFDISSKSFHVNKLFPK